MSGGQIAALIFAILLLLPGGCFLLVGVVGYANNYGDAALAALPVAAVILLPAGLLFWVAFRRRRPTPPQGPGDHGPEPS